MVAVHVTSRRKREIVFISNVKDSPYSSITEHIVVFHAFS